MNITGKALAQINDTLGKLPPERGGILVASPKGVIVEFCLDQKNKGSRDEYTPDHEGLTRALRLRTERGLELAGFAHSHPGVCCPKLSLQDRAYAREILENNPHLASIWMVVVDDNGVHPWLVSASGRTQKGDVRVVVGRPRR